MSLGPWAIAKRLLRIQIVLLSSPQYHLLDGVMDKALTFNAEGPAGSWVQIPAVTMKLFQKIQIFSF